VAAVKSGIRLGRQTTDLIPQGTKIRPLRDYILLKPLEWKPSKIIQIAGDTRKPLRGVVVAVGPGHYPKRYNKDRSKTWDSKAFQPTDCKVGDTVEIGGLEHDGYDFPQVMVGAEMHVLCREADVCCVVK
jgi:co-chaperonin GroES (HSP10)